MNKLIALALFPFLLWASEETKVTKEKSPHPIYGQEISTLMGEKISLSSYQGKVLLVVNTASKCGFTGQYEGLEKMYQKYKDQGLVVIGFPSGDFRNQEFESNEEIQKFCKFNFGVSFPMSEKVVVKGKGIHPLFKYLTNIEVKGIWFNDIQWNFEKFLIDRKGNLVDRYRSLTKPDSDEVEKEIVKLLKES